ncbi:hypothetical protein Tco_1224867, partial [Tanacetum coccineum]
KFLGTVRFRNDQFAPILGYGDLIQGNVLNGGDEVLFRTTDPPVPKRIFKYLKGTINMGLWYPKDSGFELTAFSDVDHAGCLDTRKSTSGGIQFLGDKLVMWMRQSMWRYLQVVLK